jgi:hypothetical protein
MKRTSTNPNNGAPAAKDVKELVPQPEPPAGRRKHKVIMNVFGKRFELTHYVEMREIPREPGTVIEMPKRTA